MVLYLAFCDVADVEAEFVANVVAHLADNCHLSLLIISVVGCERIDIHTPHPQCQLIRAWLEIDWS